MSRWWRRGLRGTVLAAVAVLALVGVRELVTGDQAPASRAAPADPFPAAEAAAVAGRFTWSYLTWNEEAPEARAAGLQLDYAGGEEDLGWDGQGRQQVLQTLPGQVRPVDETRATVTVLALVTPYTAREGKPPTPAAPVWRALEVPVAVTSSDSGIRVVVTGPPGLIAVPTPVAADGPEVTVDSDLSTSTRDVAEAFFTAYAAGDAAPVVAPNAPVTAPAEGTVRFESLPDWEVYERAAGEDLVMARAVVRWADPATGARLDQTYTITLTTVTSSAGTRWQVNGLTGGH